MPKSLYKDKDLSVDFVCLESLPCQHLVCITGKKKRTCETMWAPDIVSMFTRMGKHIPDHFKYALGYAGGGAGLTQWS
jgi:hypothetical protein